MRTETFERFPELAGAPAIIMGNRDLRRLRTLVERHADGPDAHAAEQLEAEIQRAIVVPQGHVPPEIVAMGSRVVFREVETGLRREVVLAFPEEADASRGYLSVLSPIGAALLGAAAGEVVPYASPRGWGGEVLILSVARGDERS